MARTGSGGRKILARRIEKEKKNQIEKRKREKRRKKNTNGEPTGGHQVQLTIPIESLIPFDSH